MPINSLNELYAEELVHLHDAERQLIDLFPELKSAASSDLLERTFDDGKQSANKRRQNVERILERYGIRTSAKLPHSRSVEALVDDIRQMIRREIDPGVRDAALVGFVQRFLHQEMAGYGTARAYAKQIGDDNGADLLDRCVSDEERVDNELTRIATEEINPQAKTLPADETKLVESHGVNISQTDSALGKGSQSGVSRQGAMSQDERRPTGSAEREGTPPSHGAGGISGSEDAGGTEERPRR